MSKSEHSKQSVENGQQSTLTSDLQKLSSKQVQRRKFLKASAVGAPMLLTLRSGAALAATSATCDIKLADLNPKGVISDPTEDEGVSWVRAMGTKHTFTPNGGDPEMLIEVDGTLYELNMSEQLVEANDQGLLMDWQDQVSNNMGMLVSENVNVLVYFDENHQMSVESSNGSPLTTSCWVSIQPTAP